MAKYIWKTMSSSTLQIKRCKLASTVTIYAHVICMQERAHETILRAWKSLHANIKFVEPWILFFTHQNWAWVFRVFITSLAMYFHFVLFSLYVLLLEFQKRKKISNNKKKAGLTYIPWKKEIARYFSKISQSLQNFSCWQGPCNLFAIGSTCSIISQKGQKMGIWSSQTKYLTWLNCVVSSYYLYGAFYCMFWSRDTHVFEWIYTLQLPECQDTLGSKKVPYLKFKWLQRDSNPQPISL